MSNVKIDAKTASNVHFSCFFVKFSFAGRSAGQVGRASGAARAGLKKKTQEEIERNGRGPLENGLGADSGADFHVDDVDAATE